MAKILIVDDNATHRSLLVTLLGYAGHALFEASDGAEGLAAATTVRPGLVITDILMPTMDGFEFVRHLRAVPEIAETPVIFCTAHYHERDAGELARDCGVSHVLIKPLLPEVVIEAVDACLGTKSTLVASPVDEDFDREHLRLLTDKLSEQTGELTIANLRLEALLDMSVQLALESNPDRLLRRFCAAARDLIAARFALVSITARDEGSNTHMCAVGFKLGTEQYTFPTDHDVFRTAMEARQPTRLRNPGGDPAAMGFPATLPSFNSLLIAPIVSPNRVYGWLCLFHRLGAVEFSEEDQHLAGILAALVGRVYENGRLYAAERLHAAVLESEIADRRKAQEESAQLAEIVQSSEDAIAGLTVDGNILSWNRGAEHVFGYAVEDVRGRPISQLFSPQAAKDLREALLVLREKPIVSRFEATGIKKMGGLIDVAVTLSPILKADGSLSGSSAIVRDITEQKRLQQQLLASQKMEAVGRLAGGVAHDFNNLLTVINGYSAQVLDTLNPADALYHDIEEINKAGDRAASLTRQLLIFSRRQVVNPQVLDLNAIVSDVDRMLRRVLGEDIDLVTVLDPALDSLYADPGQIEQIIMNLAVNARDAMATGGHLLIETANVELDNAYALQHRAVIPGPYVMLAVSDTGCGMDQETQEQIFEPFFTTKPQGEGTGLGLSTVLGIVQQSGGNIWVYSEPGKGATLKIYFPKVAARPEPQVQQPKASITGGSETILVVEDEDGVRNWLQSVLKRVGYTVLAARAGSDALLLCESHVGPIHLVITDVVMPKMSGREFADRLAALRPQVKVLFMSGYTGNAIFQHGAFDAQTPFMQKPFTPQTVAGKVREILDARSK